MVTRVEGVPALLDVERPAVEVGVVVAQDLAIGAAREARADLRQEVVHPRIHEADRDPGWIDACRHRRVQRLGRAHGTKLVVQVLQPPGSPFGIVEHLPRGVDRAGRVGDREQARALRRARQITGSDVVGLADQTGEPQRQFVVPDREHQASSGQAGRRVLGPVQGVLHPAALEAGRGQASGSRLETGDGLGLAGQADRVPHQLGRVHGQGGSGSK